jgi:ABC-2 type transport system ATP-binding protein
VSAAAIRLEHLGKRYGRLTALKDVSLEVPQGEVFGFLGLNGAGKTCAHSSATGPASRASTAI